MGNKVPMNASRLSLAMAERGLGARDVDAIAGLAASTIHAVFENGGIHTATPIGRVAKLLDATGLTWAEAFDDSEPTEPTTALSNETRTTTLARLLTTSTVGIPIDHLCVVFGVCEYELLQDIEALDAPFAALGFTVVYGNNGVVRMSRGHDPISDDAERQLAELSDCRRGLDIEAARTLWLTFKGGIRGQMSKKHRLPLARLANRGVIDNDGARGVPTVSDATLYCLTID